MNQRLCKHAVQPSPYSHQTEGGKRQPFGQMVFIIFIGERKTESQLAVLLAPLYCSPQLRLWLLRLRWRGWRRPPGGACENRPELGTILMDRLLVRTRAQIVHPELMGPWMRLARSRSGTAVWEGLLDHGRPGHMPAGRNGFNVEGSPPAVVKNC